MLDFYLKSYNHVKMIDKVAIGNMFNFRLISYHSIVNIFQFNDSSSLF